MITEEIRAVLVAAGLTPDKSDVGQLQAAVATQIAAAVTGVVVVNRDVTMNEVTNTTTETTVYTFTVPGATLGTTKALRLTLIGDHYNNDGADRTLTIRVKYGATTILSGVFTVTSVGGTNRLAILGEVMLVAANSATAQVASGDFLASNQGAAGGTMSVSGETIMTGINNAVAEDSANALALTVTVQHGVASGNVNFRLHSAVLELMN